MENRSCSIMRWSDCTDPGSTGHPNITRKAKPQRCTMNNSEQMNTTMNHSAGGLKNENICCVLLDVWPYPPDGRSDCRRRQGSQRRGRRLTTRSGNTIARCSQDNGCDGRAKSLCADPDLHDDELAAADAILFGTPTRFGNMCGQMRQFLDATGPFWSQGTLVGKVASVFTSSATQHGGQESTILSFHVTLLHHGMIIVGLPYAFQGQKGIAEISGCSPYGASTITGGKGERMPSANELAGARFQGKHVTTIASKLFR